MHPTPTVDEARVNQAMARIARERIHIPDSSKFEKRTLCSIILLANQTVITDINLRESLQRDLEDAGIELIFWFGYRYDWNFICFLNRCFSTTAYQSFDY